MRNLFTAAMLVAAFPASAEIVVQPHRFTANDGTVVAAELGSFDVPRHHADPDGPTFTLKFVRFPSTNPEPGAPIVYLAGGPGGSGIDAARGPRFPLFMALREVADVIALDQRGTGASAVDPDCRPPVTALENRVLTRATFDRYLEEAARYCSAWWKEQSVDLSAYTTVESADDLDVLRRELGADKLNLWSISYGTHLALAAAARMEDRIERMVLASAEGTDQTLKLPAHTDAYFERLDAVLRHAPGWQGMPPLPELMQHVLGTLNEKPAVVTFTREGETEPVSVTLDAFPVQLFTASGLIKNPSDARNLPGLYAMMSMGNYEIVARNLDGFIAGGGLSFSPMSVAMDVASGISPRRLALYNTQAKRAILGTALNFPLPQFLGRFDVPDLGTSFRAPVKTSVPALMLTGTLDGRTYPEAHREILDGLENGQQIVIENAGHDLFMAHPAITTAIVKFLSGDDDVDTTTLTLPAPEFRL